MLRTIILCPYFNDAKAFSIFAAQVEEVIAPLDQQDFSFLLVNDGSSTEGISSPIPITTIHLHRNLGHQKAIAIGLAYASKELDFEHIIVMDCDGEDQPSDIPKLLSEYNSKQTIIAASRASRQEGSRFRFFYWLYKIFFSVLTGKKISFGNFMLLPRADVERLVYYSEIWNHLAGAVIKSKRRYSTTPLHRGKRYAGNSQMDFTGLLLHGLGAIGVFLEIIASRLLLFSLVMIGLSLVAIIVIFFIRLFTSSAIPGWATSAVSSMLIVLLQSFLLSLFTIFIYLTSQSQRKFIPAHHYSDYVHSVESRNHE